MGPDIGTGTLIFLPRSISISIPTPAPFNATWSHLSRRESSFAAFGHCGRSTTATGVKSVALEAGADRGEETLHGDPSPSSPSSPSSPESISMERGVSVGCLNLNNFL